MFWWGICCGSRLTWFFSLGGFQDQGANIDRNCACGSDFNFRQNRQSGSYETNVENLRFPEARAGVGSSLVCRPISHPTLLADSLSLSLSLVRHRGILRKRSPRRQPRNALLNGNTISVRLPRPNRINWSIQEQLEMVKFYENAFSYEYGLLWNSISAADFSASESRYLHIRNKLC